MKTNNLILSLRKFVLIKTGLQNIDPGNCKNISEYVFRDTKNYVSETTIKRFFGFANVQHNFSLFTLNSLSQYIGYQNWQSFIDDNGNHEEKVKNIWADIKFKARSLTQYALTIKKHNSGIPFNITSPRSFYYPDFDYFLNNNYQFTTISAQPGCGKSILVAHLVDHFFLSENAPESNSTVLLINSTIIRNIMQYELSIFDWIYQEFKIKNLNSLFDYVKNNPKDRDGKCIIIIDGIDEFLNKDHFFKVLVDFLQSIEENDYFKVVLSLRTNHWINLTNYINKSAFLTKSWYKGLFSDTFELSNVPALSNEEVLKTLSNLEEREVLEHEVASCLLKQFHTPCWLQIYYTLKKKYFNLDLKNPVLCYELINIFLDQEIFLTQKSTEKIWLLKKIAKSISVGKKGLRASKEAIISEINVNQGIYEELINNGLILEEKRYSTTNPTEVIKFTNFDIYAYIIFIDLIDRFDYKLKPAFFEHILENFSDDAELKNHLINWAIRFCVKRDQIENLNSIFSLAFSSEEKNKIYTFICLCVDYEVNKPNSVFPIKDNLINLLFTHKIVSPALKKAITSLSEKNSNNLLKTRINLLEGSVNIFNLDKVSLQENLQVIKKGYAEIKDSFPINVYEILMFFHQDLEGEIDINDSLKTDILSYCYKLIDQKNTNRIQLNANDILHLRLTVIYLFSQKEFVVCIDFIKSIFKSYTRTTLFNNSVFSTFLLQALCECYIKTNNLKKAEKITNFLEKLIKQKHIYHTSYCLNNFYILKANLHLHTQQYEQALENINIAWTEAARKEYKTQIVLTHLIKIDILKNLFQKEQLANTINDFVAYLKEHKIVIPNFINVIGRNEDNTFEILKAYSQN